MSYTNVVKFVKKVDREFLKGILPQLNSAFYQSSCIILPVGTLTELFRNLGLDIPSSFQEESDFVKIGVCDERLKNLINLAEQRLGIAA